MTPEQIEERWHALMATDEVLSGRITFGVLYRWAGITLRTGETYETGPYSTTHEAMLAAMKAAGVVGSGE